MLKLQISKRVHKFLIRLPAKHQNQLGLKIKQLRDNGHLSDSKLLKGSCWYRVDVGEYRLIYAIEDEALLIIPLVGKRNDDEVYKKLRRFDDS